MSTLDILKQIIDREMNMPKNRVWAYNADMDLPKDSDLFIILFLKEQTPFSNNVKYVATADGMEEHQTTNIKEEITVSLVSKSTQARDRAYEAVLALNSLYSKQLQAQNKLHISILGSVYDASFLEGTSMLNRWDLRIRVLKAYDKIKVLNSDEYYDKFPNTGLFEGNYYFDNYTPQKNIFGFNTKFETSIAVGFSTAQKQKECTFLNKFNILKIINE